VDPSVTTKAEDDDEDEDDTMNDDELEKQMQAYQQRSRNTQKGRAICGESGTVDANWKPPFYQKTPEQEARLKSSLMKSFMFQALSEEDLVTVIGAFMETPAVSGSKVIVQGDEVSSDGPGLYVLESGHLSVYKNDAKVADLSTPGHSFGELALLYNAPRAATIVADGDCLLWSIDRNTFNAMVKDGARKATEQRMNFLKRVPILKGLTSDELISLCDAMTTKMVPADHYVIKKGEKGTEFYIVERGHCEALVDGSRVMAYDAKDYFGELALLNDNPRAADVVTTKPSKLLVLDAGSFQRLLGPLDELLRSRAQSYEGVSFAWNRHASMNASMEDVGRLLSQDSDDEDDTMDDEEFEKMVNARMDVRKSRALGAISAEKFETDANWTPPVHPKAPEQELRLKSALMKSFMFSCLSQDDLAKVILSFQQYEAAAGSEVIRQGDKVDEIVPGLFVLESGRLNVFKDGGETPVFTYEDPGQYFGELALLYNAPRAATVIAESNSLLWYIDRTTFTQLVMDASRKASDRRRSFLAQVDLFQGLTPEEMANLCDALQPRFVEAGTFIITAGDMGSEFFILEDGQCEARKGETAVKSYSAGSYFGELALIRHDVRAADVVAVTETRLLVLDAAGFKRILGPLDDLMMQRADAYGNVSVP
jgi:cAMP-dependent protein kinase regulator